MHEPLDKLVQEAREHLGTREASRVDWPAVDKGLFERIEGERRSRRSPAPVRWKPVAVAGALALTAAGVALGVLGSRRRDPVPIAQGPSGILESPEDLVSIDGDGRALVDGITRSSGARIRVGDLIETQLAAVTLQRPGKVRLTLDPESRVRVTRIHETLVLSLERGAVEARVTPVAHGEAFAVDVEGSRVAVHGTYLRVQRDDPRVIVDLKEGVIAIGEAPRVGPVLGAVVVAPAHAEFMAEDVLGTLGVSHEASTLRWPAPSAARAPAPSLPADEPRPSAAPASRAPTAASSGEARPTSHAPTAASSAGPGPATTAAAAEPDLASVVRRCIAERPHAENLTIVVKTTLYLTLGGDGSVQSARFDPPVAPDVNACAAQSIYRARFEHGGTLAIAVDFEN
jgi:hypothetical protein